MFLNHSNVTVPSRNRAIMTGSEIGPATWWDVQVRDGRDQIYATCKVQGLDGRDQQSVTFQVQVLDVRDQKCETDVSMNGNPLKISMIGTTTHYL